MVKNKLVIRYCVTNLEPLVSSNSILKFEYNAPLSLNFKLTSHHVRSCVTQIVPRPHIDQ